MAFRSTAGKPRSGTEQVSGLGRVMFWREWQRQSTPQRECGAVHCCQRAQQGMKVLGTPLGHPAFVAEHLRSVSREQQVLLDRTPLVRDLQSAWLLLLHCASARVNYLMRAVNPDTTAVNLLSPMTKHCGNVCA